MNPMKGFSRSLRYFSILAAQYTGLALGLTAICTLFYLLQADAANGESFLIMLLLMLCIFIAIFSIGHHLVIPPLALSYSCTRRSVFLGTQWMMFLIVFVILVLMGIYCQFFTGLGIRGFLKILPSFLGLFFGSIGLGALFGGIALRFGKAALMIMSVCSGLLGGVAGFCFAAFSDLDAEFLSALTQPFGDGMLYLFFGGLVFLLAGSAFNYVMLSKTSVTR